MATSFAQRSPLWQCHPSVHIDRLIGRARRTRCDALYLGIDFGTSGSRAIVIDEQKRDIASAKVDYERECSADDWRRTLSDVLKELPESVRAELRAISVNGTSGTALLCDSETGEVFTPPKPYYEAQSQECIALAKKIAPKEHMTTTSTSVLCKLISWHLDKVWQKAAEQGKKPVLLHQADWIAGNLHGIWDTSDYNNVLKLGYDPGAEEFPQWLASQEFGAVLPPTVLAPGTVVGKVTSQAAESFGLSRDCLVVAGTTDSVAAFLAADTREEGVAVTSLGSTLAVKLLSKDRIEAFSCGVYSQRLETVWLVGGASLTGGAVLKKFFTNEELDTLTKRIDPDSPTGLDYYPLLSPGERFPEYDPDKPPRLEPRPEDDAIFLQGMLEGMTNIEAEAYSQLRQMGASKLRKVFTAGGGAKNKKWIQMRAAKLGVPVIASFQAEAAYGSALLALRGAQSSSSSPSEEPVLSASA